MAEIRASDGIRVLGKGEIKPLGVEDTTPPTERKDVFTRLEAEDTRQASDPNQNPLDAQKKKDELSEIVAQLRTKMAEIDKITNDLDSKRRELERNSPLRSKRMLEEIILPPLELLK